MISVISRNDISRELRDPVSLASAVLLGAGTVISLRIALAGTASPDPLVAAGGLWIALLFGNLLVVGRPISEELEAGTLEALAAAPVSRTSIVFGKALGATIVGMLIQLVITGVFVVGFPTSGDALDYVIVVLAVVISAAGFAVGGTLVGLLSLRARGRSPLAAGLLLPLALPVLIVGVIAALPAFGGDLHKPLQAICFLAGYVLILATLCVALGEELLVE